MDLSIGIAAAATEMSMARFQSEYSLRLLKQSMDDAKEQAVSLIEDMMQPVSEYQIDIRV